MERSKVPFENVRIFWVLMGVGEGCGEDLTLVGPESGAVYRGETPEQRLTQYKARFPRSPFVGNRAHRGKHIFYLSYRKVVSALVYAQHVAFSTIAPVRSPQDALRWEAMGGL